jgi:hypothetical protein
LIYQINDYVNNQTLYCVADAQTQSQGQALNIPDTVWNVGTIDDANVLLQSIQQAYLEFCADRFSVCHATINDDGIQTWSACDLTQEQPNTDQIYQIFNTLNASYTEVIGLDNAKTQLKLTKQAFLAWSNLITPIELTELPKPFKKQTEGTQTF